VALVSIDLLIINWRVFIGGKRGVQMEKVIEQKVTGDSCDEDCSRKIAREVVSEVVPTIEKKKTESVSLGIKVKMCCYFRVNFVPFK